MSIPKTLLRVIRPHIVIGGALGYTLGVFFPSINSRFDLRLSFLGYLTIFFIDLSTHYSNDLYDAERDKEANWKPFGSRNVLIKTPEIAPWVFRTAMLCSLLSLMLASFLVIQFNISGILLILTIVGNVLGWGYSHPYTQLKAKGLGEIAIALGTGFIIPAIGYIVVTGFLTRDFVMFAAPMVLYGFIMSVFLEIPDLEVDRRNGVDNLSVKYGYKTMMRISLLLSAANTLYYLSGYVPFLNKSLLSMISLFPLIGCLIGVLRKKGSRKTIETNTFLVISGLFAFIISLNIILICLR